MARPWSARGKGLHFVGPALVVGALLLFARCNSPEKRESMFAASTTGASTTATTDGGALFPRMEAYGKQKEAELLAAKRTGVTPTTGAPKTEAAQVGGLGSVGWSFTKAVVQWFLGILLVMVLLFLGAWGVHGLFYELPTEDGRLHMKRRDASKRAPQAHDRVLTIREKGEVKETSLGLPTGATHVSMVEPKPQPPQPPAAPKQLRIPSYGRISEEVTLGEHELMLGISASGPRFVNYESYGPGFVAGLQGSYKTGFLVFLVAQMVEAGRRVLVLDPDAGNKQSLVNRLGALADERVLGYPIGHDEKSVKELLIASYRELSQIIDQGLPTQDTLIVLDEANAVAVLSDRQAKQAYREMGKLMTWKARKQFWTMVMALQRPVEKDLGQDGILACMGWSLSGNIGLDAARRALKVDKDMVPSDIPYLPTGSFYTVDKVAGEVVRLECPEVSLTDCAAIASKRLSRETVSGVQVLGSYTPGELDTTQPLALVEDVDLMPGDPDKIPVARYRELHSQGLSNRAVLEECWGEGVGGRKYTRELKNLREATASCTCGSDLHKEKVSV